MIPESVLGDDTIAAVSTPPGRGGIGVVRISGPAAVRVAAELLDGPGGLEPRRARTATLVDEEGRAVDRVVVTFFQAPHSYTAEDVVEISCHGSPAVLGFTVERALAAGARLAEPGEFTLRAFRNGRIDLTQAEAVGDLISATTLYQARVAMQQLEGGLSKRLQPIKQSLKEMISLLEAGIDFAEDDVDVASDDDLSERLRRIRGPLEGLAASFRYGRVVKSGITLAILGRPNVGKSSLFNCLLERERAIVTAQAGTTRDVVSEHAQIDGLPVELRDTAGLRSTSDLVESKGVERSYEALAESDLVLAVIDLSVALQASDRDLIGKAAAAGKAIVVGNKCDLRQAAEIGVEHLKVSAKTGEGVAELRREIRDRAAPEPEGGVEQTFITSLRQERLLRESLGCLDRAAQAIGSSTPHEMLLLDLYGALRPIDRVTGETTTDDILAEIFSTFCIGK